MEQILFTAPAPGRTRGLAERALPEAHPTSRRHRFMIAAATGAALAVLLSNPSAPRAQLACITDWSEAAPIVRREGLAPIELVDRLARDRSSVQILRSSLCRDQDRYVYRLTVRGGEGTLRTLVVDARHPFD